MRKKVIIWNGIFVSGIAIRLLIGRPDCLQRDYSGVWGSMQYMQLVLFGLAACLGMIGFAMGIPMLIQLLVLKYLERTNPTSNLIDELNHGG